MTIHQPLTALQEVLRGWSDRQQTDEKMASTHQTGIRMISVIRMRKSYQSVGRAIRSIPGNAPVLPIKGFEIEAHIYMLDEPHSRGKSRVEDASVPPPSLCRSGYCHCHINLILLGYGPWPPIANLRNNTYLKTRESLTQPLSEYTMLWEGIGSTTSGRSSPTTSAHHELSGP
jgi:hypothetical protein